MYITLAQNVQSHTYEIDQMMTAKNFMINHSFCKFKNGSAPVGMPLYIKLDFMDTAGLFRIHHNPTQVDSTGDLSDLRGLILVGTAKDTEFSWKDLYYNLVDSKKHGAIHIPKSFKMEIFYLDSANNKITKVPDDSLYTFQIVLDIEKVN